MKPNSKNRIFCPACQKAKMQFSTREKADNFIKFNKDKILESTGKAPVRSYYCKTCCAWHVTSAPESLREVLDSRDRRNYQFLHSSEINKHKIEQLNKLISQTNNYLMRGQYDLALSSHRKVTDFYETINFCDDATVESCRKLTRIFDAFTFLDKLDERLREKVFKEGNGDADIINLKIIYENTMARRRFADLESELRRAADKSDREAFRTAFEKLSAISINFKGPYKGELNNEYRCRLNLIRKEFTENGMLRSIRELAERDSMLFVIERLEELPGLLAEGSAKLARYILGQCRTILRGCSPSDDTRLLMQTVDVWELRFSTPA